MENYELIKGLKKKGRTITFEEEEEQIGAYEDIGNDNNEEEGTDKNFKFIKPVSTTHTIGDIFIHCCLW